MRLAGKSALITGAARGIGLGFARAYADEGARVTIADIDLGAARAAAAEIGEAATAVQLDVSDEAGVEAAMDAACDHGGGIDILVNNAALFDASRTVDITRESFERLVSVNVAGTLWCMRAAARRMIEQGRGGKIINMASQAGRRGEPLVLVYCMTKAAVISMTQSAGLDLIAHGINVNAIAPGVVDGAHWVGVDAKFAELEGKPPGAKRREVEAGVPAGRFAVPEDLAPMAVFLASPDSDYVVAQCYNVDGGQWMS